MRLVERNLTLHESFAEVRIEWGRTGIGHQAALSRSWIDRFVYEPYGLNG